MRTQRQPRIRMLRCWIVLANVLLQLYLGPCPKKSKRKVLQTHLRSRQSPDVLTLRAIPWTRLLMSGMHRSSSIRLLILLRSPTMIMHGKIKHVMEQWIDIVQNVAVCVVLMSMKKVVAAHQVIALVVNVQNV